MAKHGQTKRNRIPDSVDDAAGGVVRLCAVTRQEASPEDLIRFVKGPDGALVPDLEMRLPGRGVWVSCHREILEKAIKTRAFSRSLHADVVVGDDIADRVEGLLERRAVEALALANKAGDVILGFQQVDAALEKGNVGALVHSRDAAEDGRGKLDRKFRAISAQIGLKAEIVDILTAVQMGLAIGRPSVVHAALIPGGLAKRFLREAGRLARFRFASASGQFFSNSNQTKVERTDA